MSDEQPEGFSADEMRRIRDGLLKRSDWTQLPDATCDRDAWLAYRQELRDLPADPNWPNVDLPERPE